MGQLFGTDGIRGIAGRPPLTSSDVVAIGRAAGAVLREKNGRGPCRIIVVRDTRASGPEILNHLSQGFRENGIEVHDAGVLSTPAGAFLVRAHRYQSGAVISASHNPPEFNGIKFFGREGRKWPDEWEELVEKKAAAPSRGALSKTLAPAAFVDAQRLATDYEDFLIGTLPETTRFDGLRVALDCSHGANHVTAPAVLKRLGADLRVMGCKPNGKNINVGCGSQHTEKLAATVREKHCDVGVAFDGDGDRVIFVDEKGAVTDGDHIIALLAAQFKRKRCLENNKAVITVMANLGLKKALSRMNVEAVEVAVGDRHVSAAMHKHSAVLGGEQSGHIILGRYLPTGDGLLTALHVLAALTETKKRMSVMAAGMKKFPQVLLNVPIRERVPMSQLDGVPAKISQIETKLGFNGRVLVRYSGTEPLLRIMLEGPRKKTLETYAADIASTVLSAMGLPNKLPR